MTRQAVYITDDWGKILESQIRSWVAIHCDVESGTTILVNEQPDHNFLVTLFPPLLMPRLIEVKAGLNIEKIKEYSIK